MNVCNPCKLLCAQRGITAKPMHLVRVGHCAEAQVSGSLFVCPRCEGQWQWFAPSHWVLRAPPESVDRAAARTPLSRALEWLGSAGAGWRRGLRQGVAPRRAPSAILRSHR